MAYTLTQARTLLTTAELAIFDQSRAAPIKALTPARLQAKVTRARALRDKYRDLYRRQTVATRGKPASRRSAIGGDNERTGRKAEVFAEVLGRFEARLAMLTAAAAPKKTATRKTAAVKTQAKATPKTASKAPSVAVKKAAKKAPAAKVKPVSLQAAVKKALQAKQAEPASPGPSSERSAKAPSPRSPQGAAAEGAPLASAPMDVTPRAQRLNPLKERAGNLALHAHAGSQTRRAQGKRDSR